MDLIARQQYHLPERHFVPKTHSPTASTPFSFAPTMTLGRWQFWWTIASLWMGIVSSRVHAAGDEVVVVYARNSPESKSVAEYYATRRGVPENQLIGLNVNVGDNISRSDFSRLVELPLIEEMQNRRLCRYEIGSTTDSNFPAGRPTYKCVESKVRYLLLSWGFPYRIPEDPTLKEAGAEKFPELARRNEASVDSDLTILGAKGFVFYTSCIPNFASEITNTAIHPTNGLFMVTRLDGPTKEIAMGLVDKALNAETNGLLGEAYFDERGLKEGAYVTGDRWITNAALVTRTIGYPTYVDHLPDTIPATFPMCHVAVYAGWYDGAASGPFAAGTVEFMPGAIAYHLHSYSAVALRSTTQNWVGPLLNLGATVTMGSVAEPYLDLTPQPHRLIERMLIRGFTFGEASIACQSHLSWQNVFIGDPLYRPLGRGGNPLETLNGLEADYKSRGDPREAWVILRKINLYLDSGRPRPPLLRDLLTIPQRTNSAIIAEKIAQLHADNIDLHEAVEWGDRALKLAASPAHKHRLLQNLSEWESILGHHAAALARLVELEKLRPDFRELSSFRQKELSVAREGGLKSEVDRLLAELERLKPKPTP